jgi:hypothetical protein
MDQWHPKMLFHREEPVGGLHPVSPANAQDFGCKRPLGLGITDMFDHRVAENEIE